MHVHLAPMCCTLQSQCPYRVQRGECYALVESLQLFQFALTLHTLKFDMQSLTMNDAQGAAGGVLRAPAVAAAVQADAHGGGRRPVLPDRALLPR
jgi:hypothetical protein